MLKNGDRVVVQPHSEYGDRYANCVGTVCSSDAYISVGAKVAVQLDNHTNNASKYGWFYFSHKNLKLEETTMVNPNDTFMTKEDYDIVEVEFCDSMTLCDVAYFGEEDITDKYVVVKTASHGFAVAKVRNYTAHRGHGARVSRPREIVCAIDISSYRQRCDMRINLAALEARMQQRCAALQDIQMYQAMAAIDPELARMFDQYKLMRGIK